MGSLCEGGALFPPPFDLQSSAALADNEVDGTVAVELFQAVRSHTRRRFHLQITEVVEAPDGQITSREVVNTTLGKDSAVALLADTAADLDEMR